MSERIEVIVPKKHRVLSGCPGGRLIVKSAWQMTGGKIGVWVGEPTSDRVYPISSVTADEVLSWQPGDVA